jgi:DNA-binding GntR family transcriptional regulator
MAGPFDSLQLEHSSTVDRVVEELRRAVFEGELEAGTPLREVALADSLGVSRSTIREALGTLVADGIAAREPNRGVWVTAPDPDSIADVCRARMVLETAGARRWNEASTQAKAAVREALDAYLAAVVDGAAYQELNERHLALHISFVGLTESPRVVAMAEALMGELKVALAQIDRIRRNAHDQAGSHRDLVALMESGNTQATVEALEQHPADAETAITEAYTRST